MPESATAKLSIVDKIRTVRLCYTIFCDVLNVAFDLEPIEEADRAVIHSIVSARPVPAPVQSRA
jgi:hypothetical protein